MTICSPNKQNLKTFGLLKRIPILRSGKGKQYLDKNWLHFTDRFLPNTALHFVSRPTQNCLDYRGFQNGSALLLAQSIKMVVMHNLQTWVNIHVQRCRTLFLSYPVTIWRKQYRTAEVIYSKVILKT